MVATATLTTIAGRETAILRAVRALPCGKLASYGEIARRAGVSHAAPKHHFPTLGHLLGEIAARGFERFTQALEEAAARASDASPEGRLLAMGLSYFKFAERNPAIYGLMFGKRDQCEFTPHLAEAARGAWMQLQQATASVVGPARAPEAAMLVFSAVHGYATMKMESRIPLKDMPEDMEHRILRLLMNGLKGT